MKFSFFFIVISFFTFQNIDNQYIEVEYIQKKYPIKELKPTDNPILKESRALRYKRFISYTLVHQGSKSLFKKSKFEKQYKPNLELPSIESEKDVYYKDFKSNELVGITELAKKRYEITDNTQLIKWTLGKEQKHLLGYKCFKAEGYDCISNRQVIAWYSPMIPIANGPFHFCELPGLILQVEFMAGDKVAKTVTVASINQYNKACSTLKRPKIKYGVPIEKICEDKAKFISVIKEKYKDQNND